MKQLDKIKMIYIAISLTNSIACLTIGITLLMKGMLMMLSCDIAYWIISNIVLSIFVSYLFFKQLKKQQDERVQNNS